MSQVGTFSDSSYFIQFFVTFIYLQLQPAFVSLYDLLLVNEALNNKYT